MVDKVAQRLNITRRNWYDAFKMGLSIKGYEYYKIPEEIRFRYPAPGSVALDDSSYPHLFKKHWKTPFRDSHFNIRPLEKKLEQDENTKHYISGLVTFNPDTEPHLAGMQMPDVSDLEICSDHPDLNSEEMTKQLWEEFEDIPNVLATLKRDYSPYINDYSHDYNQVNAQWRDRGASGFLNEAKTREFFVELEFWIEGIIGEQQIRTKKVQFYKGTPKKWQVLDDNAHDRDQIEKMQAAIQAPTPEQLEHWQEKHSKPMQLPFNNENVTAWRDDPLAIESADFDPEFLQVDRKRSKQFFLERYEKPKELTE